MGPPVLEPGDQLLQRGHRPGDETVGSQGLQPRPVLPVVHCDEVVDAHGGVAVCHVEPAAWAKTNKQTHKHWSTEQRDRGRQLAFLPPPGDGHGLCRQLLPPAARRVRPPLPSWRRTFTTNKRAKQNQGRGRKEQTDSDQRGGAGQVKGQV